MKQLLTTKEIADKLQVSVKTIFNRRQEGMPFKQIGSNVRFDLEEVSEWIEKQNNEAD